MFIQLLLLSKHSWPHQGSFCTRLVRPAIRDEMCGIDLASQIPQQLCLPRFCLWVNWKDGTSLCIRPVWVPIWSYTQNLEMGPVSITKQSQQPSQFCHSAGGVCSDLFAHGTGHGIFLSKHLEKRCFSQYNITLKCTELVPLKLLAQTITFQ